MDKYLKGAQQRLSSLKMTSIIPFLVLAAGAFIVIIGLGIGKKTFGDFRIEKTT